MGSYTGLSQCCALYSAVGIIFQAWIGIMLIYQPFFVGGIDDVQKAKGSAFGAAGMFFFTFLISIIYLIADAQFGFGDGVSIASLTNNSRPNARIRRDYDLVSIVQEYHEDDNDNELGEFT